INAPQYFTMTNENPSSVNIKQHCGRSVLTESEIYIKMVVPRSSRVEFITTFSYSVNEYKDMMKAQVHVTQVFRCSDTQNVFLEVLIVQDEAFQGRLFDSFQDEGKYEHVVPKVTRLQEGKIHNDVEVMMQV
ncbi:hypothetical protein Tco_0886030, partial [Tanacetum coccineum]